MKKRKAKKKKVDAEGDIGVSSLQFIPNLDKHEKAMARALEIFNDLPDEMYNSKVGNNKGRIKRWFT